MALKIVRADEPAIIENTMLTIYGQQGVGKTSLGFAGKKVLLIDFDNGKHRSAYRGNALCPESWDDVALMTPDDLAPYNIITIDSVGRALELYAAHLVLGNHKLWGPAGLSQQGFGVLGNGFKNWLSALRAQGKDIVLLAHDKEEKKNDAIIPRLDAMGNTKSEVPRVSDQVGYFRWINGQRVIDFGMSEDYLSKDSADIGRYVVPDLASNPYVLDDLLGLIKHKINTHSLAAQVAVQQQREWSERIFSADAEELTKIVSDVKTIESENVQETIKRLIRKAAKDGNLEWDKEKSKFVNKEKGERMLEEIKQGLANIEG